MMPLRFWTSLTLYGCASSERWFPCFLGRTQDNLQTGDFYHVAPKDTLDHHPEWQPIKWADVVAGEGKVLTWSPSNLGKSQASRNSRIGRDDSPWIMKITKDTCLSPAHHKGGVYSWPRSWFDDFWESFVFCLHFSWAFTQGQHTCHLL